MSTLTFEYKAVDRAGVRTSGVAQAGSEGEAVRQLAARGLTPLAVKRASGASAPGEAGSGGGRGRRVSRRAIAHFTSQLGVLLAARVPISDVLLSIADQESEPAMKAVILDLAHRIEAGENLSTAMRGHLGVFGETYVQTVRAAEHSGTLSKTLELLSEMIERTEETRNQVKAALTYPAVVLCVLAMGCTFLIGYVVPKFARMFEARKVELPALTRLLQHLGESVQSLWWLYLLVLAGVVLSARAAWRRPGGRAWIETQLHRVPVIKRILPGLAISRFSQILGLSLSAGVNLIDSLDMAGRASGQSGMRRDAERLVEQVKTGGRLSESLRRCTYLTPFTKRMLSAGEAAGELSKMCSVVARHYDRETKHLTKTAAQLIEPVLIVGIAGMVLVVALAIFLPMWNMVNLIG